MRPFRSILARAFVAAAFSLAAAPYAFAQHPPQANVTSWIDDALAEAKRAGAADATHGPVTYDAATGNVAIADVTITLTAPAAVTLTISRIEGSGLTAAGDRFKADSLALVGLVVKGGEASFGIERASIDKLDIKAFAAAGLVGSDASGLAAHLRQANLDKLSIPTITFRGGTPQSGLELIVRDTVYESVTQGVVKRVGMSAVDVNGRDGSTSILGHFGTANSENVDLAIYAALFAPSPALGNEMRTVYAKSSFEGGTIEVGKDVKITIGPMSATNARMRPPKTGILGLIAVMRQMEESKKDGHPDPAALRAFASVYKDWLDLAQTESLDIGAIEAVIPDGTIKIERISGKDIGSAHYGRFAVEGFELESPKVNASVGSFAITDLDFGAFMQAVMNEMAEGHPTPNPAMLEGRLPRIGGIELKDIEISPSDDVSVSLDSAVFNMGQWRGFVPDLLRLTVEGLEVPNEAMTEVKTPTPADLGYDGLTFNGDFLFKIDEAAKTVTLSPGRLSINDVGAVSIEAGLANVDSSQLGIEGLSNPTRLLAEARFNSLRLRVENAGFLEKYLDWAAKQQKTTPEKLKAGMIAGLNQMLAAFLTDAATKQKATQALEAFSKNSRSLTVVATPKGGPLSLVEFMALSHGSPDKILARFDLAVTAND